MTGIEELVGSGAPPAPAPAPVAPAVPSAPAMPGFAANAEFVKPGVTPTTRFNTILAPDQESAFRKWVTLNNVPFDPNSSGPQDYDMRGFYKGLLSGDPHATTGMNPNDKQLHFSDWWKTPYHESFSAESQWANPRTAPRWNDRDQLVTPGGRVVFDERARKRR